MEIILHNSVETLKLGEKLNSKLKEKHIIKVEELWELTRKELKKLSFTDQDIHKIIIGLELHGLDLGKKIVKF